MALPRELRDLVYDHIITYLPKIIDVTSDRFLQSNLDLSTSTVTAGSAIHPIVTFLPNIAYTNETIYQEFVPKFLKRIYLQVGSTPDFPYLENFLDTLSTGKGWDKIVNLTILDMASIGRSPGRAREVVDTIIQARNLEVLVVNFKLQDLWCPPDWPKSENPKNTKEARAMQANPPRTADAAYLMREYQFEHLFGIEYLKRMILKVEHGVFEYTPRSVVVLDDLKNDLMNGLKNGHKNIKDVTCKEVDGRRPGIMVFIISVERL
jgi:hypothetical protein